MLQGNTGMKHVAAVLHSRFAIRFFGDMSRKCEFRPARTRPIHETFESRRAIQRPLYFLSPAVTHFLFELCNRSGFRVEELKPYRRVAGTLRR